MLLVLKTDNGPHPPETWAGATAQLIFPLVDIAPQRQIQARKVQTAIMEALVPHHTNRQNAERDALTANGDAQLSADNDAIGEATAAFVSIKSIVVGTPWEQHFAEDAVRDEVIRTIAVHMQTINHIERQYHAKRSQSAASLAFLAKHGA